MTRIEPIEEWDVLDLLTSLVDKSLVVYEEDEQGAGRYRLLETVRQYARDKLAERGASEAARHRHRDYFLGFAEAAEPELRGPQQKSWCDRLETEHDNLRAVLDWCLGDATGGAAALRLGYALHRFWWTRGYLREGQSYLQEALARPEATGRLRSRALTAAALMAYGTRDSAGAYALQQESLRLAEEVGDNEIVIASCYRFGMVAFYQSDFATARSCLERALHLAREMNHAVWEAYCLVSLGVVHLLAGEHQEARQYFAVSLHVAGQCGQLESEALCHLGYGMLSYFEGDIAAARSSLERGLAQLQDGDLRTWQPSALESLGRVLGEQGEYSAARVYLEAAVNMNQDMGRRGEEAHSLVGLARLSVQEDALSQARRGLRQALPLLQELGMKYEVAEVVELTAQIRAREGLWGGAARLYGAAASLRERTDSPMLTYLQKAHQSSVAVVAERMGEAAYAIAWQAGRDMTIDQAIACAREVLDESEPHGSR